MSWGMTQRTRSPLGILAAGTALGGVLVRAELRCRRLARRLAEAEDLVREHAALRELSDAIARGDELAEVAELVAESAAGLLNAEVGVVLRFDPDGRGALAPRGSSETATACRPGRAPERRSRGPARSRPRARGRAREALPAAGSGTGASADEFARADPGHGTAGLRRIRAQTGDYRLTVSVGVADLEATAPDLSILECADRALDRAKSSGRDTSVVYRAAIAPRSLPA